MSMTTEQLIKEIDEFIEINKNARQIGNELMNNIKGRFEHLERKADKSYKKGLEDAWEIVRRIHLNGDDCFLEYELNELFDSDSDLMSILLNFSAKEVVEKVKEYDEKKKAEEEAKKMTPVMGDVVEVIDVDNMLPTYKGVYLYTYGTCYVIIFDGYETPQHISVYTKRLRKTGQHVDLEKLFEGITE